MSLKYIAVLLDGSDTDVKQRAAFDTARRHGARLQGIFVMPPPASRTDARSGVGSGFAHTPGITDGLQRGFAQEGLTAAPAPHAGEPAHDPMAASEQRAERARHSFEQALASAGIDGEFEALSTKDPNVWLGILEGNLTCDLLISGKPSDSGGDQKGFQRFVTESGIPVLIIPDSARDWSGRNVAIGWNGSPQAMRAVRAAFPLIEECKTATIVMVKARSEVAASSKRLQQVLEAHGPECDEQQDIGGDLKISDALVARVETSDMLVVGAYGRSRLHEMILGGTTRGIVQQATIPLLIAH